MCDIQMRGKHRQQQSQQKVASSQKTWRPQPLPVVLHWLGSAWTIPRFWRYSVFLSSRYCRNLCTTEVGIMCKQDDWNSLMLILITLCDQLYDPDYAHPSPAFALTSKSLTLFTAFEAVRRFCPADCKSGSRKACCGLYSAVNVISYHIKPYCRWWNSLWLWFLWQEQCQRDIVAALKEIFLKATHSIKSKWTNISKHLCYLGHLLYDW